MNRNNLGQFSPIYEVDETYFDVIDNEEKAYILGFFYADGCNSTTSNRCISFTQLEQDKDILIKINKSMRSSYPLREVIQSSNKKLKYILSITNSKLSIALENLGAISNKSLTLNFPSFEIIPETLMHHFIRGYFDGDGCIWDGKPKYSMVKDERNPGKYRKKLIHNVKFTITGNFNFINSLQDYLVTVLGFKKTKLNFSKAKNTNNNTSENVCTMEYSGRKQIYKFYTYLYSNSNIFGDRKKQKFEIINCALNEKSLSESSLTAGNPLEL